jgi:hypothetical protein
MKAPNFVKKQSLANIPNVMNRGTTPLRQKINNFGQTLRFGGVFFDSGQNIYFMLLIVQNLHKEEKKE